jgi:hypothetical protein
VISSLLRLLSTVVPPAHGAAFAVLFIGTCFAALAQPLLLNTPAQMAGNWFNVHERDLVTTVGQ